MSHRKRIKHVHQPGDFHELTFSCYRRMPLLTNDSWRAVLSRCINDACKIVRMELIAFVYMPEHVHLLVFPLEDKPDMGNFLAQVKQPVSSFIKEQLLRTKAPLAKKLTVPERPGKEVFRFWQEGPGFDRNLFKPTSVQASIDYIHKNPVERKLCSKAIDWKWSSARYYLLDPAMQQFAGLPYIHGIRPEAFDDDPFR